jgi:hypothetical protein
VEKKMSWNELSEREKNLDGKISKFFSQTINDKNMKNYSHVINLNEKTIEKFMKITGADKSEREFIISRIKVRIKICESIIKADKLLNTVDKLSDRKKIDDEWEQKGREMGINITHK